MMKYNESKMNICKERTYEFSNFDEHSQNNEILLVYYMKRQN
jgi:hypothetical protein